MGDWLAPLLGLAGTAFASGLNYYSVERTNRKQEKAANLQYLRQQADIRAMNQYNSPAAQVMRLRNAGINPALYYGGNGANIAGEQSSIAQYDQPRFQAPSLDAESVYKSVVDLGNMQTKKAEAGANIKYLEQKSKKLAQDFALDLEKNPIVLEQARQAIKNAKADEDKTRADIDKIYSEIPLLEQQVKNAAQQFDINEKELEMALAKFPKEMLSMDADRALKYAQIHKMDQDIQLAWATLSEVIRHNASEEKIQNMNNRITYYLGQQGLETTQRGQNLSYEMQEARNRTQLVGTLLSCGTQIVTNLVGSGTDLIPKLIP